MPNKFTKGILERQEREYQKQKASYKTPLELEQAAEAPTVPDFVTAPIVPEISAHDPVLEMAAPQSPVLPLEPSIQTVDPTPIEPPPPSENLPLSKDLSAYIVRDGGRKAKNKTFYLDGAVIQGIKRAATAQHVTESKLVNDILKKLLVP